MDYGRKRPRVGHAAASLLQPVEEETAVSGRARSLRGLLLHVGQARAAGDAPLRALRAQAREVAAAFGGDAATTLDALFDGCVRAPA